MPVIKYMSAKRQKSTCRRRFSAENTEHKLISDKRYPHRQLYKLVPDGRAAQNGIHQPVAVLIKDKSSEYSQKYRIHLSHDHPSCYYSLREITVLSIHHSLSVNKKEIQAQLHQGSR